MSDGTQPPEDNDLGQNARSIEELTLDVWGSRSAEHPPQMYEICCVCGFPYKRSLMVKFREKWYCRPQSCAEDIKGILLKENPEGYLKNQGVTDSMR